MRRNKGKKLLALVVATIMMVAMIGATVSAAGTNYSTARANDSVETTSFTKNLKITNECNIPSATFTFEMSAGAAVAKTDTTLQVFPGVTPAKVKFRTPGGTDSTGSGSIVYAANLKEDATAIAADNVTIKTKTPDDEHYIAQKTMTLDFSDVTFTEPGVYRYIITENGTNIGVENDQVNTRTLDVYVEDASTDTAKVLKIANYVLYKDPVTAGPSNNIEASTGTVDTTTKLEDGSNPTNNGKEVSGATKSVGFQNSYPAASLTFGKEVKGNQGSKDKYFKFTLTISGAPAGTLFDVDITKADATIAKDVNAATTCIPDGGAANATSLTAGIDGSVSANYYLQDGQYITVYGLSKDMEYTVTEDSEEYTSSDGIAAADSPFNIDGIDGNDALNGKTSDTITDTNTVIYTGFTNTKNGIIPTGVIVSATALIIAAIVAFAGVVFFGIRSKRRFEEE